jgi:uncharacterized protein
MVLQVARRSRWKRSLRTILGTGTTLPREDEAFTISGPAEASPPATVANAPNLVEHESSRLTASGVENSPAGVVKAPATPRQVSDSAVGYHNHAPAYKPSTIWLSLIILGLVAAGEGAIVFKFPLLGVGCHVLALVVLFYGLQATTERSAGHFLSVLLIGPLIRLLSLALPVTLWSPTLGYLMVSLPLFAGVAVVMKLIAWRWTDLGFWKGDPLLQIAIGMGGVGLGWIQHRILMPDPLAPAPTWSSIWLPAVVLFVCTGLLQELIFRGLIMRAAVPIFGVGGAVLYSATLFALMHVGYASFLNVGFVFGVGLLFGWLVTRTGSLFGTTLAHGLTNVSLFLVWPFWTPA